jgi:poly-gamma-glutamate capsule biosynthesis protein CapA/YwtB (metallophosphatase superfamily)
VVPAQGITIAAVGDIMMGTDYPENILPDDDGVSFLAAVAPVLSAADVTFGNLEGVLMDGGDAVKRCKPASKRKDEPAAAGAPQTPEAPAAAPAPASPAAPQTPAPPAAPETPADAAQPADSPTPGEPSEIAIEEIQISVARLPVPAQAPPPSVEVPVTSGSCYVFRSPTRYVSYLRDAGFDVISLANNHAQDFGDPGRDSSMATLDTVGIHHSGREGDIATWTAQGRRFAMVAFAPNVGSHQLNDLARAQAIVSDLAARHDIVIVSFHGGGEGEGASTIPFTHEIYAGEDRGNVVEFAHTVIDAGADLVIGHGPHVLRAVELYRDRLIAYSLGNFATYYGISVTGIRGVSGILTTRVDADGRFLEAHLASTVQIRPAGPSLDPERRAVTQLRDLTSTTFPTGTLRIEDDGRIVRTPP